MLAGAPTGLYGYVEENRKRSLLLFGGFLVAIELMAFVLLLGPTLMYDVRHNPLISPLGYLSRYVVPVALAGLAIYAAKLWWFVGAVQKSVGFHYVDNDDEPRFCRILEPLAIAAGIATPYAAVIDSRALNAFACGVRANHMVVVATRGLIDGLDDDELAAVLAHEVIHIKNHDTFLLASANTFMATLLLAQRRRQVRLDDWRQAFAMVILPVAIPLFLMIAFLTQLALRIGYCSRAAIGSSREFIADAEAVRLTKNPAALVSALRKVEGHSRIDDIGAADEAMMIDGPVEGPLATHPTVTERIAALARTTGAMIFDGGTRLDTRAPALAGADRVRGFGRRDVVLERIATLAEAPPRAGLWEIFRKTRDPDRNLFGFNRRASLIFLFILGSVALIATADDGRRFFKAQLAFVDSLGQIGRLTRGVAACDASVVVPGSAPCDPKGLDVASDAVMAGLGLPHGVFRLGANIDATYQRQKHCYSDRFTMTPAALTGPPQGSGYGESLDTLVRSANNSTDDILLARPGLARDRALKDYVSLRKLLLNDALYFTGKDGMDAVNAVYRGDNHGQVIALLNQRLKDPSFVSGDDVWTISDLNVFATDPFGALPCDVIAEAGPSVGSN